MRNKGFAPEEGHVARTDDFVIAVYALVKMMSMCLVGSVLRCGSHLSSVGVSDSASANRAIGKGVEVESETASVENVTYEQLIIAYNR